MDKAISLSDSLDLDNNRRQVILMLMITEVPHSVEQRFEDFGGRFLLVALEDAERAFPAKKFALG